MHFLIDYDRHAGRIVKMEIFDEANVGTARATRMELELSHKHSKLDREVVLLEAASEAAIRKTHRRYFADLAEFAKVPDVNGGPNK